MESADAKDMIISTGLTDVILARQGSFCQLERPVLLAEPNLSSGFALGATWYTAFYSGVQLVGRGCCFETSVFF